MDDHLLGQIRAGKHDAPHVGRHASAQESAMKNKPVDRTFFNKLCDIKPVGRLQGTRRQQPARVVIRFTRYVWTVSVYCREIATDDYDQLCVEEFFYFNSFFWTRGAHTCAAIYRPSRGLWSARRGADFSFFPYYDNKNVLLIGFFGLN